MEVGNRTGPDTSFPPSWKSESYPIIISATQLMNYPSYSITNEYLTHLLCLTGAVDTWELE